MKNKKYTYKCTNGEYIESKFELGDVVKVTSFGSTYTSYFDAFKAMNVSGNDIINDGMGHYKLRTFNYEEFEEYKNDNYVIIDMCVHCRGYIIYLIRHIRTNIVFVIDDNGIKLNRFIPTHITRSLRTKNENKILTYLGR